jgi:sulfur-oxidizing protein SoxY
VKRRVLLLGAAGVLLPAPIRASEARVAELIAETVGGAELSDGKIKLDLPLLVENGNVVAMSITVDASPGSVRDIHVFADGNPQPEVARFHFGPRAGAPHVATRIRLATSQTVTAIARMRDGTCWRDSVQLLVTLAACIE